MLKRTMMKMNWLLRRKAKRYYLYLEFKSASLIITKSDGSSTDYRRDNKSLVKKTTYKVDLENPLKVNHISNMLHCMFGFPPVPSMIDSIFEVNEKIYDLALNHSYIKYDNKFFYLSKKCKTEKNSYLKSFGVGLLTESHTSSFSESETGW